MEENNCQNRATLDKETETPLSTVATLNFNANERSPLKNLTNHDDIENNDAVSFERYKQFFKNIIFVKISQIKCISDYIILSCFFDFLGASN